MRPCMLALAFITLLTAPVNAGFELSLEQKLLRPASPDETVDIYLTSRIQAEIHAFKMGAFIGSPDDVHEFNGLPPYRYRDDEGNFQLNASTATSGVQYLDAGSGNGPYFWDQGRATFRTIQELTYWGANVAQTEVAFVDRDPDVPPGDHFPIAPGATVKIGTLHIDTTNISADSLTISLYGPNAFLQYGASPGFTVTTLTTTTGDYAIDNPSQLRVVGKTTLNIAHTPEPSMIGLAGLGLTAGMGWLRARARRHSKDPQQPGG